MEAGQVKQVVDFMQQVNGVLDVIDFQDGSPDVRAAELIAAREKARQAKDFATADALRKELDAMGVRVADGAIGT